MTKRRMFLRMITASLLRRRSRMLIALLSIGIGATILAGLVTIYVDVPRQMGAQFRSFGANMLILSDGEKGMSKAQLDKALENIPAGQLVGAAPYRYVRVDMTTRQQSFTAAGTDFDQITKTSPYFSIEGRYPENPREVLVGKEIAETIGIREGSGMELTWQPAAGETAGDPSGDRQPGAILPEIGGLTQTDDSFNSQFVGKSLPLTLGEDVDALSGATITSTAVVEALNTARNTQSAGTAKTIKYTVTGILATGGEEESYVFMSLEDMAGLTGSDAVDVAELSVSASAEELETYAEQITENTDGVRARLVKRVTRSETAVLGKLQSLVFLVTAVVLILTMICVSTTMMAVVSERRREIGLRKALGASDGSIRTEFLGEGMFLGLLGGILGAVLGFAFAQVVSVNVFGSSITFQPLLLPAAVIVSMGVAALSCLQPIKRAVAIDPAIVLKDE